MQEQEMPCLSLRLRRVPGKFSKLLVPLTAPKCPVGVVFDPTKNGAAAGPASNKRGVSVSSILPATLPSEQKRAQPQHRFIDFQTFANHDVLDAPGY
jgi:hypothetical protein